ncbi:MAG TPA: hypothetical protein VNM92_01655 [Thermoanaerobaculia bacterium]|nr:hypothetical protein [Thermoanaerobaculia bacterium]
MVKHTESVLRLSVMAFALFAFADRASAQTTKIEVTYHSDPPGASVYEEGRLWGVAPIKIKYNLAGKFKECAALKAVTVRWVSGAEVSMGELTICPQNGKKQQFSFMRPTGIPGIELDVTFAIDMMRSQAAQHAASAASDAAGAAAVAAVFQRPKQCITTVIGTQIFTNCS